LAPTERSDGYSRALERFVGGADDIQGLVAYAIYKQTIRQRRMAGQSVPKPAERDPAPAERGAYRAQALRLLEMAGTNAVEAAAPSILQSAVLAAQRDANAAMNAELRRRTGLSASIVTGVVVWPVTIGLTVLLALAEPDWVRNLVAHVGSAG
jgi:hypothetical protein